MRRGLFCSDKQTATVVKCIEIDKKELLITMLMTDHIKKFSGNVVNVEIISFRSFLPNRCELFESF